MKFKIIWSTGKEEIYEQADCTTVEQAIGTRFGSAWEHAMEAGVVVELINDEVPVAGADEPKGDEVK